MENNDFEYFRSFYLLRKINDCLTMIGVVKI